MLHFSENKAVDTYKDALPGRCGNTDKKSRVSNGRYPEPYDVMVLDIPRAMPETYCKITTYHRYLAELPGRVNLCFTKNEIRLCLNARLHFLTLMDKI
jgi:hypothetical protein